MSIPSISGEAIDLTRSACSSKFMMAMKGDNDRLPPHSDPAEEGVLGCILWSPDDCLTQCQLAFKGREVFYDHRRKLIYETLVAMQNKQEKIDLITLQQRLKDKSVGHGQTELDLVGGITYLSALQDSVPSAANLSFYVEIVEQKYVLREMIMTCSDVIARAHENEGEVEKILSDAESGILSIRMKRQPARSNNIKAIQKVLTAKYQLAHEKGAPPGLMSGFPDLDRVAGGMQGQEMIVIAGIQSSGKTSLAMNIVLNVAESGTKVSFNSLETSAEKLVHRYNCICGRVEGGRFLRGEPSERDFTKMTAGIGRMMKLDHMFIINDDPADDGQLRARCRQDYAAGARLFVVDYLQLIAVDSDSETERVTKASMCIKGIAKELNCPVIVMAALSRADKKAKPRRPILADLKQSSQIEYDADKVYLLHTDPTSNLRTVNCNVAKNKDGETGDVELTMFAAEFRFESASKIDDADVPGQSKLI